MSSENSAEHHNFSELEIFNTVLGKASCGIEISRSFLVNEYNIFIIEIEYTAVFESTEPMVQ